VSDTRSPFPNEDAARIGSIRRRLLAWQIGALLLTGLMVSLITYSLAWNAFNRVRDYNLEQIAYSVLRHGVVSESGEEESLSEDRGQFLSQIWTEDGQLVYTSRPDIRLPPQKNGLNVLRLANEEWHIYTLRSGGLAIQVAHTSADRAEMFARIIPWLTLPMGLLIAGLGGLIWMAVGRALRPLDSLRGEIGARDVSSLHALDTRHLPEELAPLVGALNALLARLEAALTLQSRFIADAAHELRTPLTAVRLQAQIAQQARNAQEREAALAQLLDGVDRASHLVQQLLDMARLAPEANRGKRVLVALDALAKAVVADFSSHAEARGIDLGVGACAPVTIVAQADALRVLLGNLVDNALRYTPPGGRVDVEVVAGEDCAMLTVADNGPGIPLDARERVFERFCRLAPADIPGSGLGLSIVRDIVTLHRGSIQLEDTPGGGLTVRVALPFADEQGCPLSAQTTSG
jgi:signal transduction histidine kinase